MKQFHADVNALRSGRAARLAILRAETAEAVLGTQANKKLMQDLFAAIELGDRRRFVDTLADDVVMHVTGQYSWSRSFRGKASLTKELYGHLAALLAEGRRSIPQHFIAEDDYVVVQARGDMMTKAGARYDNDYCLVYRLADARIVEIWEYCDSALTEAVLGKFPTSASGA